MVGFVVCFVLGCLFLGCGLFVIDLLFYLSLLVWFTVAFAFVRLLCLCLYGGG